MDLEFKNIRTILEDYAEYSGEELQIPESLILKTANDTLQKIMTGEQLDMRLAILDVKNYQAELPKGFKSVAQALYKDNTHRKVRREEVVEYVQKIWGSDCELKINIECPECHKETCDCNSDVVTVNVDRMWQDSHPEFYASKRFLHNFGRVGEPNYNPCTEFKLMRRKQGNFHAAKYHLEGCVNLSFDDPNAAEYDIYMPKIVTSFKDGEILLSYLSLVVDQSGYLQIPDHARVYEALFYAIDERVLWRKYRISGDPKFRDMWNISSSKAKETISLARSAIQVPNFDEWMAFTKNHWTKFIPNWGYEQYLNASTPDAYRTPKI